MPSKWTGHRSSPRMTRNDSYTNDAFPGALIEWVYDPQLGNPYLARCSEDDTDPQAFGTLREAKAHVEEYRSRDNVLWIGRRK